MWVVKQTRWLSNRTWLSNNQQKTFSNWTKALPPAQQITWCIFPRPSANQRRLSSNSCSEKSFVFWELSNRLHAGFWRALNPGTTCLTGWIRGKWFLKKPHLIVKNVCTLLHVCNVFVRMETLCRRAFLSVSLFVCMQLYESYLWFDLFLSICFPFTVDALLPVSHTLGEDDR